VLVIGHAGLRWHVDATLNTQTILRQQNKLASTATIGTRSPNMKCCTTIQNTQKAVLNVNVTNDTQDMFPRLARLAALCKTLKQVGQPATFTLARSPTAGEHIVAVRNGSAVLTFRPTTEWPN